METLHLIVSHKSYDRIISGEEKIIRRRATSYWTKRLMEHLYCCLNGYGAFVPDRQCQHFHCANFADFLFVRHDFSHVCIHRGYSPITATFELDYLEMEPGYETCWLPDTDKQYFVITIGKRI